MYHYKARVYSPTLGRFLQTDPVGYEDQFNLYAYVGNDPINRTDPTGTQFSLINSLINDTRAALRTSAPRSDRSSHNRAQSNAPSTAFGLIEGYLGGMQSAARDGGASHADLLGFRVLRNFVGAADAGFTFAGLHAEGHSLASSAVGTVANEGTSTGFVALGGRIGTAIEPGVGTVVGMGLGWLADQATGIPDAVGSFTAENFDRAGARLSEAADQASAALYTYLRNEDKKW